MALSTPTAATPYGLSLRTASFRGVEFGVEENAGAVGRRGQTHEYPFRDEPYDEDLGRRARRVSFKAFLLGDDVAAQRDQLIDALEQKGPGELVHPNLGSRQMAVDKSRPCSFAERWDKGRLIEFDLAFVEPGRDIYPSTAADTQAGTTNAAGDVGAAANDDLSDTAASAGGDFGGGGDLAGTASQVQASDNRATGTLLAGGAIGNAGKALIQSSGDGLTGGGDGISFDPATLDPQTLATMVIPF